MGIEYNLICTDCKVKSKGRIRNNIKSYNVKDIALFMQYHALMQGHEIIIIEDQYLWDTPLQNVSDCKEYQKEAKVYLEGMTILQDGKEINDQD